MDVLLKLLKWAVLSTKWLQAAFLGPVILMNAAWRSCVCDDCLLSLKAIGYILIVNIFGGGER